MTFDVLYEKIANKLKKICIARYIKDASIDYNDVYQEMCIYLWTNFKNGIPENINESYITKGCIFHIQNYLRTNQEKVFKLSLDMPLNERGDTAKDIIPEEKENIENGLDRKMIIKYVSNNGFSPMQKKVFEFLCKGYTTREAGRALGISHVMVTKYKKRLSEKLKEKYPDFYLKKAI